MQILSDSLVSSVAPHSCLRCGGEATTMLIDSTAPHRFNTFCLDDARRVIAELDGVDVQVDFRFIVRAPFCERMFSLGWTPSMVCDSASCAAHAAAVAVAPAAFESEASAHRRHLLAGVISGSCHDCAMGQEEPDADYSFDELLSIYNTDRAADLRDVAHSIEAGDRWVIYRNVRIAVTPDGRFELGGFSANTIGQIIDAIDAGAGLVAGAIVHTDDSPLSSSFRHRWGILLGRYSAAGLDEWEVHFADDTSASIIAAKFLTLGRGPSTKKGY